MQFDLSQMFGQGQKVSQSSSQTTSQTTEQWQGQVPPASPEAIEAANIANVLLLIGSAIVVSTSKDKQLVTAAYIKLIAGFMFIYAAYREAQVQQIAPGITTTANRLKSIGSIISIVGALILTRALQIEVKIRSKTNGSQTPAVQPFIGGTGAFSIS